MPFWVLGFCLCGALSGRVTHPFYVPVSPGLTFSFLLFSPIFVMALPCWQRTIDIKVAGLMADRSPAQVAALLCAHLSTDNHRIVCIQQLFVTFVKARMIKLQIAPKRVDAAFVIVLNILQRTVQIVGVVVVLIISLGFVRMLGEPGPLKMIPPARRCRC